GAAFIAAGESRDSRLISGHGIPLSRDLCIPRSHDERMEAESDLARGETVSRSPGSGIRHFEPDQPDEVLRTAQGRAADERTGGLRHLVYRPAPRSVANAKKSSQGGTSHAPRRKDAAESQSAGGVGFKAGLELHCPKSDRISAALRQGLSQHW